jgi:hypothetical protein
MPFRDIISLFYENYKKYSLRRAPFLHFSLGFAILQQFFFRGLNFADGGAVELTMSPVQYNHMLK